jgi:hypothetical protein
MPPLDPPETVARRIAVGLGFNTPPAQLVEFIRARDEAVRAAAIAEVQRWIPCSERMPESGDLVVARDDEGACWLVMHDGEAWLLMERGTGDFFANLVEWAGLPDDVPPPPAPERKADDE